MVIHEGYENLKLISPVTTLGIFDGVHRGHRALLDFLVSRARAIKGESVVITFSPHPRLVLEKNNTDLSFLTTMEEKKVLLENANIDHLIVIQFNNEFSKIPACDFIKKILVEKIGTKHLIIGYNHHFGKRGEGDFNTIKQCSEEHALVVEQVQGVHTEEGAISSSSIREGANRVPYHLRLIANRFVRLHIGVGRTGMVCAKRTRIQARNGLLIEIVRRLSAFIDEIPAQVEVAAFVGEVIEA